MGKVIGNPHALSWVFAIVIATFPHSAHGDERVEELLKEVKATTNQAKTIKANFSYVTVRPSADGDITSENKGTIRLMKPNYAEIIYNPKSRYGKRIVSDGESVWTYSNMTLSHSKVPADENGQNINVWRLLTIGGFFDLDHWIERGVYVRDLEDLKYAGTETIDDIKYDVIEHKMTGTIQGKRCPFQQKIYIGPERIVSRFSLDFTLDGKPGSELATLTDIQLGEPMDAKDFRFNAPEDSIEERAVIR